MKYLMIAVIALTALSFKADTNADVDNFITVYNKTSTDRDLELMIYDYDLGRDKSLGTYYIESGHHTRIRISDLSYCGAYTYRTRQGGMYSVWSVKSIASCTINITY